MNDFFNKMASGVNKVASSVWLGRSNEIILNELTKDLTPEEKGEVATLIGSIYINGRRYVPKKWKYKELERTILNMLSWNEKEVKQLANFVFFYNFDSWTLKKKMRLEWLVWDYIDSKVYTWKAFWHNFKKVVYFPFIIETFKKADDYYSMKEKIHERILEEQKNISPDVLKKLEDEIAEENASEFVWETVTEIQEKPKGQNELIYFGRLASRNRPEEDYQK